MHSALEWAHSYIEVELRRFHRGNEVTQRQLERSQELIERSRELLEMPVPQVWRPEQPKCESNSDEPAVLITAMTDHLLARAQLAMEETRKVREQRLELRTEHERAANELRCNLLESASLRIEIAARWQDHQEQGRLS